MTYGPPRFSSEDFAPILLSANMTTPSARNSNSGGAQIRGRALHRLTLYNRFSGEDDDHSEGSSTFAGYFWVWKIEDFAGERCLTLSVADDLL